MTFADRSVKLCKHCGWGGGVDPDASRKNLANAVAKGIKGTYCNDCDTVQKRNNVNENTEQNEEREVS